MIDQQTIRARATPQSFERGQRYQQQGAVFSTVRRGATIEARCQGSDFEPYLVRATIEDDRIAAVSCTCQYDWGGDCKHVVALLLEWLAHPDRFAARETFDALLARKSKDELIALVKLALKHHPDLETLLELVLPVEVGSSRPPVDPEAYRARIRHIRAHQSYEWSDLHTTAGQIGAVCSIGEQFLESGALPNAALIFQAIVDEGVLQYESFYDDDGILSSELSRAVTGLAECFQRVGDDRPDLRRSILESLSGLTIWEIESGGYGFVDEVGEVLVDQATPDERRWLREQFQARLAALPAPSEPPKRGYDPLHWRRRALVALLLDLYDADGDQEAFLAAAREHHQYLALFGKLVELGRVPPALAAARAHLKSHDVTLAADLLKAAGHAEEALKLVEDAYWQEDDDRQRDWLVAAYQSAGDADQALPLLRKRFAARPDLATMQEIVGLTPADSRDKVRHELVALLQDKAQWELLARYYLGAKEWGLAWDVVTEHLLKPEQAGFGYHSYYSASLPLELAEATAGTHPQQAIAVYVTFAERVIDARNRGSYATAVHWLQQARSIYLKQQRRDEWDAYIAALKDKNKQLRALKAEMEEAGL